MRGLGWIGGLDRGVQVSGAGHLALVVWILFGGLFSGSRAPSDVPVTEVSLLTGAEFARLSAAAEKPAPPEPAAKPTPEPAPEPTPEPTPASLPPPAAPPPRPVDAPRVAPVAAPKPPEAAIPDAVARPAEEAAPSPTPAPPKPPAAATAPKAATTEIVTEATRTAETPRPDPDPLAPETSERPRARPAPKPVEVAAAEPPKADAPKPETPKPETQKPETPKPAPDVSKDAVNDALAAALAGTADDGGTETETAEAAPVAGPPMTQGEKAGLLAAVARCWNVGALTSDTPTVVVAFDIDRGGVPEAATIRLAGATGGSDATAQQAYEVARRAIIRCGATGYPLPPEKYDTWKSVELTFNPEKMNLK